MALNFKQIGVGNIGNPAEYMREARQGLNDGLEKLDTLADDIAKDNYAEARSPIEENLFLLDRDIDAAESTDEIDKLMADFRTQSQGTPGYTVADLAGIEDKAETRTDTLVQTGINDAADQRLDAAELEYKKSGDASEFNAINNMTTDEYMETYGIQDRATAETRQAADIARGQDAIRSRVSRELALAHEAGDYDGAEQLLRDNSDWIEPADLESKLSAIETDRNNANYEAVVREFVQVGQENAARVGEMNVLVADANSQLSMVAPGWGISIDDETGRIGLSYNPGYDGEHATEDEAKEALAGLLIDGQLQEAVEELWTNAPDMAALNDRLVNMYLDEKINREQLINGQEALTATMPKLTEDQQAHVNDIAQAVENAGQTRIDNLSQQRAVQQTEVNLVAERATTWSNMSHIKENFLSVDGQDEADWNDTWGDEYVTFVGNAVIPASTLDFIREVARGMGLTNLDDAKHISDLPIEFQGLFAHEMANSESEKTWGVIGDNDFSKGSLQLALVTAANAYKRLADGRQAITNTDAMIAQTQLDTANEKRQKIREATNAYMMTQDTQTFMRAMDRRNEAPVEAPEATEQQPAEEVQTPPASGTTEPASNATTAQPATSVTAAQAAEALEVDPATATDEQVTSSIASIEQSTDAAALATKLDELPNTTKRNTGWYTAPGADAAEARLHTVKDALDTRLDTLYNDTLSAAGITPSDISREKWVEYVRTPEKLNERVAYLEGLDYGPNPARYGNVRRELRALQALQELGSKNAPQEPSLFSSLTDNATQTQPAQPQGSFGNITTEAGSTEPSTELSLEYALEQELASEPSMDLDSRKQELTTSLDRRYTQQYPELSRVIKDSIVAREGGLTGAISQGNAAGLFQMTATAWSDLMEFNKDGVPEKWKDKSWGEIRDEFASSPIDAQLDVFEAYLDRWNVSLEHVNEEPLIIGLVQGAPSVAKAIAEDMDDGKSFDEAVAARADDIVYSNTSEAWEKNPGWRNEDGEITVASLIDYYALKEATT